MKLSFVIPTVNQFKMLFDDCIDSFMKFNGAEHEVIVVDDGSTVSQDRTPSPLRPKIQEECEKRGIKFLYNENNSGFPITVNKGIKAATGDIITVVNNDIKFFENVTNPILKSFEKDPQVGIVGALLYYPDMTIQHGGIQLVGDASFTHRGWHKTLPEAPEVKSPSYMIGVTGAVFALRKEMIDQIGAFREDYFLACEDTEFCLRAWSKGWKVYYNPEIQAIHREGATRGRTDVEKQRKHRAWYIREQQTWQKFRNDLKTYSLANIKHSVASANGVIAPTARSVKAMSNAEKIVFQANEIVPEVRAADLNSAKNSIFIRRAGALGDVLMSTGVVRALREKNKCKRIIFATNSPDALRGNPNIDLVVPTQSEVPAGAEVINLDMTYENNPKREVWKTYAEAAGLSAESDLGFEMYSTQRDFDSMKLKIPQVDFTKDRVAVLHCAISWANRTWPRPYWLDVSRKLSGSGYKVITIGKGADYRSDLYANVFNMVDRLSIQEIRELMKKASVFVGMDSGMLHVAQTTDVPIVGLFTVANPKYRIYPRTVKTIALAPKSECRFCLHEQAPPVTFVGCKFGTNACLQDITPDSVIEAIQESAK